MTDEPTAIPRRKRGAGILLHPTSLPGPFGIGDLGPTAESFLGWAAEAGQSAWQILPLGPTTHGHSPYSALSSFAGNPLLISPERLVEEGLLDGAALEALPRDSGNRALFEAVETAKGDLLRASFASFEARGPGEIRRDFEAFVEAPQTREWLPDYALFSVLRERSRQQAWWQWPAELRSRRPTALEKARQELAPEIAVHIYGQFVFFRQWDRLHRRAAELGIEIVGDLPIYPALDSADVWAHPELFELDAEGRPTLVAGVPPDHFSEDGQLWGSPLYCWDRHREEGFAWWTARLKAALRTADRVRLDHFRGFAAYWAVPAGAENARSGEWIPGPGRALFDAFRQALPGDDLPLIAEDLGVITNEVRALMTALDLPGMKILQFAFAEPDSEYLPHRHAPDSVVYTGTHDNDTTVGWFLTTGPEERHRALDYLGLENGFGIERSLIRAAYTSVADLAIIPLQDALALGSEARMNVPGQAEGSWRWRAREEEIRPGISAWLRRLAEVTGRLPGLEPGSELSGGEKTKA